MKQIVMLILLAWVFSNSSNADNQAAPPLRLKLTTATPVRCPGASLQVRAGLINESNGTIAIDVKYFWRRVSFNFFRSESSQTNPDGSGTGSNTGGYLTKVGDGGPDYEGEYIVLGPGESYKASRTIKLDDEFFNSLASYTMKVSYGQFLDRSFEGVAVWKGSVESNSLNFKLVRCKGQKKR